MEFANLLMAVPSSEGAAQSAGGSPFILMALIFGIFYFVMIRPQSKKQKELRNKVNSLTKGEKVVTIGGIFGTVSNVKEESITIKVDGSTEIEFRKSAIASVVSKEDATASKKK